METGLGVKESIFTCMCQKMTAISFDVEKKSGKDEAAEWTGVRRMGRGVTLYCNIALQSWGFSGVYRGGRWGTSGCQALTCYHYLDILR